MKPMKQTIFRRLSFADMPVHASLRLLAGLCCSLLLLLCQSSCRSDEDDTRLPAPDHMAILSLRIGNSGAAAASTVSMEDQSVSRAPITRTVNETAIHTVDVLSFKVDPAEPTNIKKGKFFYRSRGVYTETTPGEGKVQVTLLGAQVAQTLVVIANARSRVDMLGAALDEEKEAVMNRLTFDVATEASPDLSGGIPMWGELPNEIVGDNFSPSTSPKTVTLIRSVAKFTLVNPPKDDPNGKDFFYYYDGLRLYNYRSKGRIAPDNYNAPDQKVITPTVPAGARQAQGTFTLLSSEVTTGRIGIYEGKQKSFYLCEVDNTVRPSGGNALDDLCLIVYVKTHDPSNHPGVTHDGYYRLDFKDYATDNPIDILRNHDYRIVVDEVQGLPADTPEEAFNGNYTLKCKIVPWNEVQEEVIVDPVKRINVDKGKVVLERGSASVTTGQTLTITTENTGGWKIDPASIPNWVTVTPSTSTTDGTTTITIKAKQANKFHSDKLKLVGNNTNAVEKLIRINQIGKLPLEYVAEYNLAGGFQYGTKPDDLSLVTSAQTDPQLRWATNHNNDQSGYYNWFICTGNQIASYNPNTKNLFNDPFFVTGAGKGYHLPSCWEWQSIFSYGLAIKFNELYSKNINEAIEFGGTKNTYASSFFSTGNNICYALRYKQATDNPNDGSSTADFPKVTDNSMACAFRYELVMSAANINTNHLKVQCIYVGDQNPLPTLSTISQESWWNNLPTGKVITRIFSIPGFFYVATPSGSATLSNRGSFSSYLSSTIYVVDPESTLSMYINNLIASMNGYGRGYGYAVRPFSNE